MKGLRSKAMECIGSISSIGIQHFQPYVHEFLVLGLEGCKLPDQPQLREHTYTFFTTIAKLLKQKFEPYLPKVLECLMESINSKDDIKLNQNDFEDDDSVDSLDETELEIQVSYLDEKIEAIAGVGEIAIATKEKFLPYIQTFMQALSDMQDHPSQQIRAPVMQSLLQIFKTVMKSTTSKEDIKSKKLSKEASDCLAILMQIYTTRLLQDWEAKVVCESLESLRYLIKIQDTLSIDNILTVLAAPILKILQRNSEAQPFEEDDVDESRDFELIDQTLETLNKISKQLGNQFSNYFPIFVEAILKLAKSNDPILKAHSIGTIADLIKNQATDISPYFTGIIEHALNNLEDENLQVRWNAIYCINVLVSNSNDISVPYFPQILQNLTPIFNGNEIPAVVDNACGAIASLITKSPQNVPLDLVLPLLFSNLPLKEDFEEIPCVYNAIFSLFNSPELFSFIQKHIISCLNALINSIISPNVDNSWKIQISSYINQLFSKFGNDMISVVSTLNQNQQDVLKKILNK